MNLSSSVAIIQLAFFFPLYFDIAFFKENKYFHGEVTQHYVCIQSDKGSTLNGMSLLPNLLLKLIPFRESEHI